MATLNREAHIIALDTAFKKKLADVASASFVIIGDDIEELAYELNPDTERIKNILGKTKTRDNGYEPSFDADPFYADPDSGLYTKLRDIALERKKGDDCKTLMLDIIVEDTSASTHLAYLREAMVKPVSYGGDTSGFSIPFTVSEDGDWKKGTVTAASITAGAPVFTADTGSN